MTENAGFWIRLGAILLDGLIVAVPLILLMLMMPGPEIVKDRFIDVLSFLYGLLLPVFWNGFTIGKRICKIRIQRVSDERPPHIGNMLMRNVVASLIYGLTFGIALIASAIMIGVREDKRGIHDFIAGTEVVYD